MATYTTTAKLSISNHTEGVTEVDTDEDTTMDPGYDQLGHDYSMVGSWESRTGKTVGVFADGMQYLYLPWTDESKRHLLAIAAPYHGGRLTFTLSDQGDFAWDGGTPSEPIDVSDFPWVASARSALTVEVHGIFVTTTRIYGHKVPIATTPTTDSGTWIFIEGEAEADFRVWDA